MTKSDLNAGKVINIVVWISDVRQPRIVSDTPQERSVFLAISCFLKSCWSETCGIVPGYGVHSSSSPSAMGAMTNRPTSVGFWEITMSEFSQIVCHSRHFEPLIWTSPVIIFNCLRCQDATDSSSDKIRSTQAAGVCDKRGQFHKSHYNTTSFV